MPNLLCIIVKLFKKRIQVRLLKFALVQENINIKVKVNKLLNLNLIFS